MEANLTLDRRTNSMPYKLTKKIIGTIDMLGLISLAGASFCMIAICSLMLTEIFARAVFGTSLQISWEVSSYLMASMIFLAAPYTLKTGGHIRVSLILEMLPSNRARQLDIMCTVGGIGSTLYIFYVFVQMTMLSVKYGTVSATPLETQLAYPQGAMSIGAFILVLQFIGRLLRLLIGIPPDDVDATIGGND